MKALVYPGAFNPPTAAHIDLAEYAKSRTRSDKVIYVPSKMTYIRDDQGKDFAFDDADRLMMLQKIAEERDWAEVCDYELKAAKQPRTYETLCWLRDQGYECRLLFGSDKLVELETGWKYTDEILRQFGVVCLQRSNDDCETLIDTDPFLSKYKDCITLLRTPEKYQNYSSSRIRKLLRSKHPDVGELRRLLPPELYDLVA